MKTSNSSIKKIKTIKNLLFLSSFKMGLIIMKTNPKTDVKKNRGRRKIFSQKSISKLLIQ
jgi:hypothetical protein